MVRGRPDRAVFLDERSGDMFAYRPDRGVWAPRLNCGLSRWDREPVIAPYKPKVCGDVTPAGGMPRPVPCQSYLVHAVHILSHVSRAGLPPARILWL